MTLDLPEALRRMSVERPVFHSEADFQHALAWQLHLADPAARLRLETRPRRGIRLDLLVEMGGRRTAIEVKHLVRRFHGRVGGELFDLPEQAAHDISRYDVVKDVVRAESFVADGMADDGRVVVLSNDPAYWQPGRNADTIDARLRLHEGRVLGGAMGWTQRAGAGTTRGREEVLVLTRDYRCSWRDYSTAEDSSGRVHHWRYLELSIEHTRGTAAPQTDPVAAPSPPSSSPPPPVSSSVRTMVLAVAGALARRSADGTFSPAAVVAECRRRGSAFADSTVRTHVVAVMCVNAPDNHARRYADLERVAPGRYRLRAVDPTARSLPGSAREEPQA